MRGHIWGSVDAKLVAPESNLAEPWNEVVCVSQSVHRMASDNPQSIGKGTLIYRVSLLLSFPMHPTLQPTPDSILAASPTFSSHTTYLYIHILCLGRNTMEASS
jgi:hypothetical protein